MNIINLPGDILPPHHSPSDSVIIHEYTAASSAYKGKSILQKNAISLVLSGEKIMNFTKKRLIVKEGEFHFLSAGNCIASMDLKQESFKSILIFFDNKVLTDFYVKYDHLISKYKKEFTINPESYIFFKKDEFVYHFISSLQINLKKGKQFSRQMKLLKLEELLLYLLERDPQTLLSFQPSQKNDVDDVEMRKVVETNIVSNLTLSELAFLCNISLSTFKRRFQKVYGMPPNKWFLQQRMEMAANLLKNHNERPSEIFYKVGYENHSSFTQSFKQTFGTTPKNYQAQLLNS